MSAYKYNRIFFLYILNALYYYCHTRCNVIIHVCSHALTKIIIIKHFNDLFLRILYTETLKSYANREYNKSCRCYLPFKLQPFRGIIIIIKSLLIEGLLWHGSVASLKTRNVNDAFDIIPPLLNVTWILFSNFIKYSYLPPGDCRKIIKQVQNNIFTK